MRKGGRPAQCRGSAGRQPGKGGRDQMDERREVRAAGDLRASDNDRQAVTDRLTKALDEGRLNLHE